MIVCFADLSSISLDVADELNEVYDLLQQEEQREIIFQVLWKN